MTIQEALLFDQLPYPLPTNSPADHILFLDLETKSFRRSKTPILYLGILFHSHNGWTARQWLPETPLEEEEMLRDFLTYLSGASCLVHYNGNSFDIPVLEKRFLFYELPSPLADKEHLDLYRLFSPLKKLLGLPHLSLASLEQYLGLSRTGNANDLTSLPLLLPLLSYLDFLKGSFAVTQAEIKETGSGRGALVVRGKTEHPFPKAFSHHYPYAYLTGEGEFFSAAVDGLFATMKYFFRDYKNYYYLPREDMAIHKSVASYVEKEYREPAKASNCYTKKNGFFLIQKEPLYQPVFTQEYGDKTHFLLCDSAWLSDSCQVSRYLQGVFNSL